MPYTVPIAVVAPNGSAVKWSLWDGTTLHGTLRNQTAGVAQVGTSDLFAVFPTTIPDGYRGFLIAHYGADVSALSGFTGANTLSLVPLYPGDAERVEKALPAIAAGAAGGLPTGDAQGRVTTSNPVQMPVEFEA